MVWCFRTRPTSSYTICTHTHTHIYIYISIYLSFIDRYAACNPIIRLVPAYPVGTFLIWYIYDTIDFISHRYTITTKTTTRVEKFKRHLRFHLLDFHTSARIKWQLRDEHNFFSQFICNHVFYVLYFVRDLFRYFIFFHLPFQFDDVSLKLNVGVLSQTTRAGRLRIISREELALQMSFNEKEKLFHCILFKIIFKG